MISLYGLVRTASKTMLTVIVAAVLTNTATFDLADCRQRLSPVSQQVADPEPDQGGSVPTAFYWLNKGPREHFSIDFGLSAKTFRQQLPFN